jgi:hypothetical protein
MAGRAVTNRACFCMGGNRVLRTFLAAVAQRVAFKALVFAGLANQGENRNQYLNCNQDQ